MKVILLGAPASGKGSVAAKIIEDFNIPQISTGDLFRWHINNNTSLGVVANKYISKGNLVPDDLTFQLLKDRLAKTDCKNGYILDGFPRTINQAILLSQLTQIDYVINLVVPQEILEQRIVGRRICEKCNAVYNTSTYTEETCAKCGGKLYHRADDNLETIRHRIEVYNKESEPILEYYKEKVFVVDGENTPEKTYLPIKKFLEKGSKKR